MSSFPLEVSATAADALARSQPGKVQILDVREPHELAICRVAGSTDIPLGQLPQQVAQLSRETHWLVLCHHGSRSMRATQFLRAQGLDAVTNIAGGIDGWADQIDPTMARY